MKYGYGMETPDIIKNYTYNDDKLIINYLDGTVHEIPLSLENELRIKNIMLNDAINRNNSDVREKVKKDRYKALFHMISSFIISCPTAYLMTKGFFPDNSLPIAILAINSISFIINGITFKIDTNILNEIKKYSIYLSIKDDMEKNVDNANIYEGINYNDNININNLDNYSLKDIKLVQGNVRKLERYKKLSNE